MKRFKTFALLFFALLPCTALAQNSTTTTATPDGAGTKTDIVVEGEHTSYTTYCGDSTCSTMDTTLDDNISRNRNHQRYIKARKQYCKDLGLKKKACNIKFGPFIDGTIY